MTVQEAIDLCMRIHYNHFMSNPRFWYEQALQDADGYFVVAASNLRSGKVTAWPDAWLRAWPAAVKDRDKRTSARYHHER